MRLDPTKTPNGTRGFLPPAMLSDFDGDDFEWFKSPSVELQDGEWSLLPVAIHRQGYFSALAHRVDPIVYSTWQSAFEHTVNHERSQAQEMIAEANQWLAKIDAAFRRMIDAI